MDRKICEKCEVRYCLMFHNKDSNTVAVVPNFGDLDRVSAEDAYWTARTAGELWSKADVIINKDEGRLMYARTMADVKHWEFDDCTMKGGYSDRCPYVVEHWMKLINKERKNEP
jgi:hypothetical protein